MCSRIDLRVWDQRREDTVMNQPELLIQIHEASIPGLVLGKRARNGSTTYKFTSSDSKTCVHHCATEKSLWAAVLATKVCCCFNSSLGMKIINYDYNPTQQYSWLLYMVSIYYLMLEKFLFYRVGKQSFENYCHFEKSQTGSHLVIVAHQYLDGVLPVVTLEQTQCSE